MVWMRERRCCLFFAFFGSRRSNASTGCLSSSMDSAIFFRPIALLASSCMSDPTSTASLSVTSAPACRFARSSSSSRDRMYAGTAPASAPPANLTLRSLSGAPLMPATSDVRLIGTLGPTMVLIRPIIAFAVSSDVAMTPTSNTGLSNGRVSPVSSSSSLARRTMFAVISNVMTVMGDPGTAIRTWISSAGIRSICASFCLCASANIILDFSSTNETSNFMVKTSGADPSNISSSPPFIPAFKSSCCETAPGFSSVTTLGANRWLSPSFPKIIYCSGIAALWSFSPSLPFFFWRRSPVESPAGSQGTVVRGSSIPVTFCASSYSVSSTALVSLSEGWREASSFRFSSIRLSCSSNRSCLWSSRPSSFRAMIAVRGPMFALCAGRKFNSSSFSLRRRVLSTSSYGTFTCSSASPSLAEGTSLRRFAGFGGRRCTFALENWSSCIISRPGRYTRSTPSSSSAASCPLSLAVAVRVDSYSPE
mmetsp:Transcript_12864/g.31269  ORF Transcript_12864/g.31269 Transcript_12864/m.31269 type:complete len:479 (-) Transcript_12864:71-1507(-)